MSRIYFDIQDDVLVKHTPFNSESDLYKEEVIINKEMFIECYNKWIKPQLDPSYYQLTKEAAERM